jgi:hypothetical protein
MNNTIIIAEKEHNNEVITDIVNLSLKSAFDIHDPNYKYVLEFGVFKGNTLNQLRSMFDNSYYVYGFDSFEGLPEDWMDTIKKGAFNANGIIPEIPNTIIIPGLFKKTIPIFKQLTSSSNGIALLHIDSDLYSSCKDVLYELNNYIKINTIIVFDEWYYGRAGKTNSDHEQKCFYEWIKDTDRKFELIPNVEKENFYKERQIVKIWS